MTSSVGIWEVLASLTLVVVAGALAWWLQLGVTKQLAVAAVRAGAQLLAVGFLLKALLTSGGALWWSWLWVAAMIGITTQVAKRRAPGIPGGWVATLVSVFAATGVCLGVIFGFGILNYEATNVVVVAGITIGNTLPGIVLTGKQIEQKLTYSRGEIEGLLALGFDALSIVRFVGGAIASTALVPQIERTNVVGLIALPGAMTGLLLAGTSPVDAVLVQIIIMYLVLGAVAISVVATVSIGLWRSFTKDLRLIEYAPA